MPIEERPRASVITHALARDVLTTLRAAETGRADFREGLVALGRICGYEIIDAAMGTEPVTVRTPLAAAEGERVAGRGDVVLVSVLRAAAPFVEGLLEAFPAARQGMVSASRDEAAGMDEDGAFPVAIDYAKLPEIAPADTVIVADPMLATGSTMTAVLDRVVDRGADPADLFVLSAVSAPAGIERVDREFPDATLLTVAVDDRLDEEGFIVPGLGDAGDRAFGTD